MIRGWWCVWLAVAWATPAPDPTASGGLEAWITETHADLRKRAVWRSPTAAQRHAVADGARQLAWALDACDAEPLGKAATSFAAAGLVLGLRTSGVERFVTLIESDPHGAFFAVFRCGPTRHLVVQAPHAFYDVHTDDIARAALLDGSASGAMWNTVHRYEASAEESRADPIHPADVVHEAGSLFHTMSLAWLAADPSSRVVQLHGFGAQTTDADVVLSSGSAERPPRALRAPTAALLELPPGQVRAFGEDADVLGATTNVTARQVADVRPARFLHVELSRAVRDRLHGDRTLAARLVQVLGDASWDF